MKKALFIANNYWSTPFQVGTHEIAKQFIKNGWNVAYISDPISPFHLLARNDTMVNERFNIWRKGGIQINERLWTYVPLTLTPPTQFPFTKSLYALKNWHKFTIPNCVKAVRKNNFERVDFLYIDNIYQSFWLDVISYSKSMFRITDNNAGFGKLNKRTVMELEKYIASKTDLMAYPSIVLKDHIREIAPKRSILLPNGVDYYYFADETKEEPDEYKHIEGPKIIYVGAMEFWFDFELINYAAERLPNYNFILIGNDKQANINLSKLPNIHILGTRPYNRIASYLQHADVGIIPFNRKQFPDLVDAINPLKLYQYMAAGLPTLSVSWSHVEKMKSPAVLYSDKEDFVNSLTELINNPTGKSLLQSFAAEQDWSKRYKTIIEELGLYT